MKKAIILIIAILIACTLLFSGCVQVDNNPNTNQITTDKDAAKAIADVSSDLSGIKNSLTDIDNTMTDQNN